MLGKVVGHPFPETGGRCRSNGDAAFLLLLHPVHGGGAIMDLTDLVIDAGVEKDTLGRGRLAGVDVCADADISVALNGSLAGHFDYLSFLSQTTLSIDFKTKPPRRYKIIDRTQLRRGQNGYRQKR
jgi:hypothetical protein